MAQIIVLSGPIAAGKTTFATALAHIVPYSKVSTSSYLRQIAAGDRLSLQAAGEKLDIETDGAWVKDAVLAHLQEHPQAEVLLIDSARIAPQILHLRTEFGDGNVTHVHLTANDEILRARYDARNRDNHEAATYDDAKRNPTEAAIPALAKIANVTIATDRMTPESQAAYAAAMRSRPDRSDKLVDVIVGAQWGSEGKGNVCAFIANEYEVLLRVGGPNAGHKVIEPPYIYVQLPSGTGTNKNAKILIAAGSTILLKKLLKEIDDHPWLKEPGRLVIDRQAMIIEDEDRAVEEELMKAIGSTGQGVGAAAARKILGRKVNPPFGPNVRLVRSVDELKPYCGHVTEELRQAYAAGKKILLEGTQGTHLSIHHGDYPNVTSRETTSSGCLADAGISHNRVRKVIMVARTYPIRVGGESGGMGIEVQFETISERSGTSIGEITKTEIGSVSGKKRRIAEFGWDQIVRSAELNGATDIALTFADYLDAKNVGAKTFNELVPETQRFVSELERATSTRVSFISAAPGRDAMIDRREW